MIRFIRAMMEQKTLARLFCLLPRFLELKNLCCFSNSGDEGHPLESSWKLQLEMKPANFGLMSTGLSLISDLKNMLEECETTIL